MRISLFFFRSLVLFAALVISSFAGLRAEASGVDQVPPIMPNGASNLTWHWIEGGGARLYQNTIVTPRQVRLAGARWVDPASVPPLCLSNDQGDPCQRKQRRTQRRHRPRAAQPVTSQAKPDSAKPAQAKPDNTKPAQAKPAATSSRRQGAGRGHGRAGRRDGGTLAAAREPEPTTYTNVQRRGTPRNGDIFAPIPGRLVR